MTYFYKKGELTNIKNLMAFVMMRRYETISLEILAIINHHKKILKIEKEKKIEFFKPIN